MAQNAGGHRRPTAESAGEILHHGQLIHHRCWMGGARFTDTAGRNAGHGNPWRHFLDHHRASTDARAIADPDVAQHHRVCADQRDCGITTAPFCVAVAIIERQALRIYSDFHNTMVA